MPILESVDLKVYTFLVLAAAAFSWLAIGKNERQRCRPMICFGIVLFLVGAALVAGGEAGYAYLRQAIVSGTFAEVEQQSKIHDRIGEIAFWCKVAGTATMIASVASLSLSVAILGIVPMIRADATCDTSDPDPLP